MAQLKTLVNYKSGFQLLRMAFILMALFSFIFCGFIYYQFTQAVTKISSVIYVMNADGSMSIGEAKKKAEVRLYQVESAAKTAYKLWYQIDQNNYQSNIEMALNIFGECGKKLLKEYKDDQVYFNLRDKNLVLTVTINDIKIDPVNKVGFIKGIQTITRLNGKVQRNMNVKFSIYDIDPSRENPFGVKLENWEVVDSQVIENKVTQ